MESLIKLTIKTPNQHVEDIQINCDLTWTVRKLKEYLQDVYPSKPDSQSQKLIYLGHLLQDHHILKEIFQECVSQTLHIVCSETDEVNKPSPTSVNINVPAASTLHDGLRHRVVTSATISSSPIMSSSVQNPIVMPQQPFYSNMWCQPPSNANQQQLYQMQAQYLHQMHQWQMSMAANAYNMYQHPGQPSYQPSYQQYHPATTVVNATPPSTPSTPSTPAPMQPEAAPQPPVDNAPAPEENIAMNAGPGGEAVIADDARNRDWLDWMYMSLRAIMLLSIVYFYSSTTRFLLVAVLGFILYIYQAGWFTPTRVQRPPAEPQEQPVDNSPNDGVQGNADGTDSTPLPPARPNMFRVCFTLLQCFFTSLVPTGPAALPQQ